MEIALCYAQTLSGVKFIGEFCSKTDGSERRVCNSTPIGVSSVVVGLICDSSSIGRALASQAKGCGIVPRLSPNLIIKSMNKKLKITYWGLMALNSVVCIVDIATARYFGAVITGVSLAWLAVSYVQAKTICELTTCINEWMNEYYSMKDSLEKELSEALSRENIHHQTLAEMRERAQDAERKLKELEDDTPARGKNGRYVKRG